MRFIGLLIAAIMLLFGRILPASGQTAAPSPASDTDRDSLIEVERNALISALPDGGGEYFETLLLNQSSGPKFKRLIPTELHPLVRSGQLVLHAARSIGRSFRAVDPALSAETPIDQLAPEGYPVSRGKTGAVYPFGSKLALDSDKNMLSKAQKILWNAESAWWRHKFIQAGLILKIFSRSGFKNPFETTSSRATDGAVGAQAPERRENGAFWGPHSSLERFKNGQEPIFETSSSQKLERQLAGLWSRIYSNQAPGNVPHAQLSRELLQFTEPRGIDGLSFLWFRLFGKEEEPLWILSPAIRKIRQLVSSNRTDPLFSNSISLDEILVWSGKIEQIRVTGIREDMLFMPFGPSDGVKFVAQKERPGCVHQTAADNMSLNVAEDSEISASLPARDNQAAGAWDRFGSQNISLPSGALFVPRSVWRIELAASDPFALIGRQIIYVDQESGLALLRIIFDRSGSMARIVLGFFALSGTLSGEAPQARPEPSSVAAFHYPVATLSIDRKNDTHSLMFFNAMRFCAELPQEVRMEDFDPVKLEQNYLKVHAQAESGEAS